MENLTTEALVRAASMITKGTNRQILAIKFEDGSGNCFKVTFVDNQQEPEFIRFSKLSTETVEEAIAGIEEDETIAKTMAKVISITSKF